MNSLATTPSSPCAFGASDDTHKSRSGARWPRHWSWTLGMTVLDFAGRCSLGSLYWGRFRGADDDEDDDDNDDDDDGDDDDGDDDDGDDDGDKRQGR